MKIKKIELKIAQCIDVIRDAFNANIDAKNQYSHADSNRYYLLKEKKCIEAIKMIRQYALPIKYGIKLDDSIDMLVLYFAYAGDQVSFHGYRYPYKIKEYNGDWKGARNGRFPFLRRELIKKIEDKKETDIVYI